MPSAADPEGLHVRATRSSRRWTETQSAATTTGQVRYQGITRTISATTGGRGICGNPAAASAPRSLLTTVHVTAAVAKPPANAPRSRTLDAAFPSPYVAIAIVVHVSEPVTHSPIAMAARAAAGTPRIPRRRLTRYHQSGSESPAVSNASRAAPLEVRGRPPSPIRVARGCTCSPRSRCSVICRQCLSRRSQRRSRACDPKRRSLAPPPYGGPGRAPHMAWTDSYRGPERRQGVAGQGCACGRGAAPVGPVVPGRRRRRAAAAASASRRQAGSSRACSQVARNAAAAAQISEVSARAVPTSSRARSLSVSAYPGPQVLAGGFQHGDLRLEGLPQLLVLAGGVLTGAADLVLGLAHGLVPLAGRARRGGPPGW